MIHKLGKLGPCFEVHRPGQEAMIHELERLGHQVLSLGDRQVEGGDYGGRQVRSGGILMKCLSGGLYPGPGS